MYCVYCGVKLQDGAKECPLCHTPVVCVPMPDTESRSLYSDRLPAEEKNGRTLVIWLLTTVMAAVCLGCLIIVIDCCRCVSGVAVTPGSDCSMYIVQRGNRYARRS